jgi:predicted small lipoprotein YifL
MPCLKFLLCLALAAALGGCGHFGPPVPQEEGYGADCAPQTSSL